MINRFFLYLTFVSFIFFAESKSIPPFEPYIYDEAGLLSAQEKRALQNQLLALDKKGQVQMGLVLLSSLEGEVIEEYAIRLADQWKLGSQELDNGLILLVAKKEKKLRIEVGQGLEGAIPDARARQIIDHILKPSFRSGQFFEGLQSSVFTIEKLADGEAVTVRSKGFGSGTESLPLVIFWIFFFLVLMQIMHRFFRKKNKNRYIGSSWDDARHKKDYNHWGNNDDFFGGGGFGGGGSSGGGFGGGGGGFSGGGASGGW